MSYATPEPVSALVDLKDASRVILRDDVPKITNEQTANVVAVIQEFMPPVGERHLFARALSGYLIPKLKKPQTLKAMLDAWEVVGYSDPDTPQRIRDLVENTAERYVNGENIEGGGVLEQRAPGLPAAIQKILSANSANGANSFSTDESKPPSSPWRRCPRTPGASSGRRRPR